MQRMSHVLAAVCVLVSALGLVQLGSTAEAAAGKFVFRGAQPTTAGAYVTRLDVLGGAERGVAKIDVAVHKFQSREVVARVDDFELIDGTTADGTWRSRSSVMLSQHNFELVVRMWDLEGTQRIYKSSLSYGRQPEIVDYAMSPTTLDVENPTVSYEGRLVYRLADGTVRPLAGVTMRFGPGREPVTVTNEDGRFSGKLNPPVTYSKLTYRMVSSTTDDYLPAASPLTDVTWLELATRISMTAETATPAVVGGTAVLKGRLERQGRAGDWAGLPDATIRIAMIEDETHAATELGTVRTESDGTYRFSVPLTASGQWGASYSDAVLGETSQPGYKDAYVWVKTKAYHRTEIPGVNATPDPVGKGAPLTIAGRLVRPAGAGDRAVVTGGQVEAQFSADGRTWSWRSSPSRTDQQGFFSIPVTAVADGYWRVRFLGGSPDDNGSQYTPDLETTSGAVRVDVRYRTAVSSFNAAPEPVVKGKTLTVSGVLKRSTDGSAFKTWAGQTVYVYCQAKGSKVWTYAGTAKTNSAGKFVKGFKAGKDATWKAVYKGDADHLPADSPTDYVDVR